MACAQRSAKAQLLLSTWLLLMTEGWLAAALAKRLDGFIHSVPVNVDLISTLWNCRGSSSVCNKCSYLQNEVHWKYVVYN